MVPLRTLLSAGAAIKAAPVQCLLLAPSVAAATLTVLVGVVVSNSASSCGPGLAVPSHVIGDTASNRAL
jgi:hypothetical protein